MKEEKDPLKLETELWDLLLAEQPALNAFKAAIKDHSVTERTLLSEHPWSKKNPIFQGINLLWYLAYSLGNKKKLIDIMVNLTKRNLITTQMLMSAPKNGEHVYYGANVVSVWLDNQYCWGPVSNWLRKNLITTQILEAKFENEKHHWYGANTMWLLLYMISPNKYFKKSAETPLEEIELGTKFIKLIERDLITGLMLMDYPKQKECREFGVNGLWIIARSRQFYLIEQLITKNLVTASMLKSYPRNSSHYNYGQNVLWLIAYSDCWNLILQLLEGRRILITTSMLESKSQARDKKSLYGYFGMNPLWWMISKKNCLLPIIQKNLITTQMLLSTIESDSHRWYGFNIVNYLIMHDQWDVVELFVDQMNTQILLSAGKDNINAIHLLLKSKNISLIKQLLAAPLSPLKEVPWESFDTKPFMSFLLERDRQTFNGLRQLIQNYNPYATIVCTISSYVSIENFHYDQQIKYWEERALRDIQNELLSVCLFVLINQWRPDTVQIPLSLIYLIFFYTSGDQHGCRYIFPNNALELSLSSGNRIEPMPQSKDLVEKYLQNGVSLFAIKRLIKEEIIFETENGLSL